MKKQITVTGKVWRYPGLAGWHFVYVDKLQSATVRAWPGKRVGFGFVPVRARLAGTEWQTSLFPTKEGPYLISIKKSVRVKEGVSEGDTVRIICQMK